MLDSNNLEDHSQKVFSDLRARHALAQRERERDAYFLKRDPIFQDRFDWQAHTFRHLVHLLPGETICEIGAGQSLFVDALRRVTRNQNQITALTFNEVAPGLDKRDSDVEWITASTVDALGSRAFDCMIAHNMLDAQYASLLIDGVYHLLKDGGQLVFFETNPWNPYHGAKRLVRRLLGQSSEPNLLNQLQLCELLSGIGFIQITIRFSDFVYPPLPRPLIWLFKNVSVVLENTREFTMNSKSWKERRYFIGGSDARIIMGNDEAALHRLWREKRGEVEPKDLSGNLVVQLGVATEELNRRWYEANTGEVITDIQKQVRHPALRWMAATLDGRVQGSDAVFEAKFMLPWSFSEEAAADKYMPQLQHNMWVAAARTAVLSVITGGGKWVEIATHADPLYQHLIVTAERKFWRCVESGELPRLFGVEPPKPRVEAVRIVDMSASNSWAELAGLFRNTRQAFLDHERSKSELKALMPEDAKEAIGHGVRAKRSKSGSISFDLLDPEASRAAL